MRGRYVPAVRRVLILGGTTEASALARAIAERPVTRVVTSFAGATSAPRAAAGEARVGGFGGADGLAAYLRAERIDALVDATHPFAAQMRWNASAAAEAADVPRVRVERPAWRPEPGDDWIPVPDLVAAVAAIAARGYRRVFLTTGRKELAPFASLTGVRLVVRSIEWPDPMPLPEACVILDRGPFAVRDEEALLHEHDIDALVTKNSGGTATAAKLAAARNAGIPVVMVERPPNPPGPLLPTVEAALSWLEERPTA